MSRLGERTTALLAAAAIGHLIFFSVAIGLDLPRRIVTSVLSPWIGGTVSIRSASLAFPPGLVARNVHIDLPPEEGGGGGRASLHITRLHANLPVRRITLEGLHGTIGADTEGHLPLARLLGPPPRHRFSGTPPRITMTGGELVLAAPGAPFPLRAPLSLRALDLEGGVAPSQETHTRVTFQGRLEGIGKLEGSIDFDREEETLATRIELSGVDASNRSFWERGLGGAELHDTWDTRGSIRLLFTSHTAMGGASPSRSPGRFKLSLDHGSILWPGRTERLTLDTATIEGSAAGWKAHMEGTAGEGKLTLDLHQAEPGAEGGPEPIEAELLGRRLPWDHDLSEALATILGSQGGWLGCVEGSGEVDAGAHLSITPGGDVSRKVDITLHGGRAAFVGIERDDLPHVPGFPLPLHDVEARARFGEDGTAIDILDARGDSGGSYTGTVEVSRGPGPRRTRLRLAFEDVPLDEPLRDALAAADARRRATWDSLRPQGHITGTLDLTTGGGEPRRLTLEAKLEGGRLRADAFPLDLEDLTGTVRVANEQVVIDLTGLHAGGGAVTLRGTLGADPPGHLPQVLDIRLEALSVSGAARDALLAVAPGAVEGLDSLGLEGLANLEARVERPLSGASQWSLEGDLHAGRFTIPSLPLPIDLDQATVTMQARGDTVEGSVEPARARLLGAALEGSIRARLQRDGTGKWSLHPRRADLRLRDLAVERSLLQALARSDQDGIAQLASWLEPGGLISGAVSWSGEDSRDILDSLRGGASFGGLVLHPPRGNLVLRDASGRVHLAQRRLVLDALETKLGDSPLQLRGMITPLENGVRLVGEGRFENLSASSLASILASRGSRGDMPPAQLPPFARSGRITAERLETALDIVADGNVRGEIRVEGRIEEALQDASFPLRGLAGSIEASILLDGGSFASLEGSLSNGTGLLFGRAARNLQAGIHLDRKTLSIERLLGNLGGGTLTPGRNGLVVDLSPAGRFRLTADVRQASLVELLAPAGRGRRIPLQGLVDLSLPRLEGEASRIETLEGEGKLLVTNGTLWEIPVLRGVRRYLDLSGSVYFERAEATLRISRGEIRFEDVSLRSPILTVTGSGVVRPDGTCDFLFAPRLQHLLSGIDLLDPLWEAVVGGVLTFHVYGPLENPVTVPQNLASPLLERLFGKPERGKRLPIFRVPPGFGTRRF